MSLTKPQIELIEPASAVREALAEFYHADSTIGHRDLAASGWYPAFFNQQWGGAPHYFELVDGATGTPYKFEAVTGNIEATLASGVGNAAGSTWGYQGFKVSQSGSYANIWVKVYKAGNPTGNLEMRILPDDGTGKPTGSTPITNGTANAISGKLFTSDTSGQWVRFTFPTPPTLTAGTQYHITLKSSLAVDGTNYWGWMVSNTAAKYPHGVAGVGDGTPTWTPNSVADYVFLVEAPTSLASLQSGGIFNDGKLTFFEGNPLNQSNGRVKDLKDFRGLDLTDCTILVRGSAWTKDKTIMDITYGLDHDRIVLRSNVTTGFAQVDVYNSAGTKFTVTGTTDISTGNHDVALRIRAKGDGADVITLMVDGASQGTPITGATIGFDTLFSLAKIGTAWIGGGFQIAPTWSGSSISSFTGLPSTLGWTWTGTGTEANCMSVSGGKLYQNKTGYGATDTGYYLKSTAGLSNTNGWSLVTKQRVTYQTNTKNIACPFYQVADGTKVMSCRLADYYLEASTGFWSLPAPVYPQDDYKPADTVQFVSSKGSDFYIFMNGRLKVDYTAGYVTASATNAIGIGDGDSTAGENADVVHSYWKYYTTNWLIPQFTSGSLSELAFWNGDRTALCKLLYNGGSFISVKKYTGWERNYLQVAPQRFKLRGISANPTTTSTTGAIQPEMEGYIVGANITLANQLGCNNNTVGVLMYANVAVDRVDMVLATGIESTEIVRANEPVTNHAVVLPPRGNFKVPFGLHKVTANCSIQSGTLQMDDRYRTLNIEVNP